MARPAVKPRQVTRPLSPRDRAQIALTPAKPVGVEPAQAPDGPAEITTPRLRLRPLNEADRQAFCDTCEKSRGHLHAFLPLGGEDQPAEQIFERQLKLTIAGDESAKAFRRIAVETGTGAIAGAFNLIVIRRGLEWDADVSCWLAQGFTGKGIASEGLAALLSYSFADLPTGLGLHAIHAFIAPENTASQRLAAGFGFERAQGDRTHLTVGDRWQLHEKWTLPIGRWLKIAG